MSKVFNPERLKAARLQRGLTLRELSEKFEPVFSKQMINKWEKGDSTPSAHILFNLSDILNLPIEYFYLSELPQLKKVSYRKLKSLSVKSQEIITNSTKHYLEKLIEIQTYFKSEYIPFRVPNQEKKLITNNKDIEDYTEQIRKDWNLGSNPISNIINLLENKGIKIIEIDVEESFKGLSALTENDETIIVLNKHFENSIEMYRFTVLHELAHLLFEFPEVDDPKKIERYCDYFAGAMLLPSNALIEQLGHKRRNVLVKELVEIKLQFGISLQAILYRAYNLGIITNSNLKTMFVLFNKWGYRKNEPGKYLGEEKSKHLMKLVTQLYAEKVLSSKKVSEFLEINEETFLNLINVRT